MTAATPRIPVNDRISVFILTGTLAASALGVLVDNGNPSVARCCGKIQILCRRQPDYGKVRADSENLSRKAPPRRTWQAMRLIPDASIDSDEDREPLPRSARPVRMHTKNLGAEGARSSPCLTTAAFGEIMLLDGLQPVPKSYKLCLFD